MHPLIHGHRNAIAELCQRHRVKRLEVFGSATRGNDFDTETSDADFLVEFSTASKSPSLKAFFGLQTDLSKVLGRTVDLAEASAIRNPYVRARSHRSCMLALGITRISHRNGKLNLCNINYFFPT